MSGKRRVALALLSPQQRLGAAVAVIVVLYLVVAAWVFVGREPDAVSVAPAQPIFPGGVEGAAPPIPVLPPTSGSERGSPAAPTPSGGRSGGEASESAAPAPGNGTGGDDRGNAGGDRDGAGGRDDQDVPSPTEPPQAQPPQTRPPRADPPPPPPPAGPFTSRYTLTENGSRTFHARVFLTNRGSTTRNWSVRITFASSDRVSVGRTLGALKRTSGNTYVFSGFRARPGQTEIFGFDATKGVSGTVRPTGCEVDGRDCDIRVG